MSVQPNAGNVDLLRILRYASCLVAVQFVSGVVEGLFGGATDVNQPEAARMAFALSTLSTLCVSITLFATMAARQVQSSRLELPLAWASAVFLSIVLGVGLGVAMHWLGDTTASWWAGGDVPGAILDVATNFVGLVVGLLAGTLLRDCIAGEQ